MSEKALTDKLSELTDLLAAHPSGRGAKPAGGTYFAYSAPETAPSAEELVDHIRLQMKYVLFDLEATRRENRYLRQMLERRSSFGEGSGPA